MRGSPVYQITQLWQQSGINCIGTSRHAAKAAARSECQAGGINATPHLIGARTGIFSYGTADAYRDVWIAILKHARELDGTRNAELLTGDHAASFLRQKVANSSDGKPGVAFATYQQYAAAAQKLAVALQYYSDRQGTGRSYDFSVAIREVSAIASATLARFSGSRAYRDPSAVIQAIDIPDHQLAARLQYTSGARVSEIALVRPSQLLGMRNDPVTGEERGCIRAQGKGGRIAHHLTDPETYRTLSELVQLRGEFRIDKDCYRDSLRQACVVTDERYSGTHGFRWNRAAERVDEAMSHGLTYDQALACTAELLLHSRTAITEHYRK